MLCAVDNVKSLANSLTVKVLNLSVPMLNPALEDLHPKLFSSYCYSAARTSGGQVWPFGPTTGLALLGRLP